MIGRRFGPYEIVAKLGEGGMGEVYRATDTRLDRTVAIKILAPGLASDPEFRERFEREARSISQLNHPHICTLHDVGHQDGVSFLVLEYLEGETLATRLAKGPLPLDQTLSCAMEIADALDKAHRRGIVHRDLKPGNVMLTKAGAKLLDFGLAKIGPVVAPGTVETRLATAQPIGSQRPIGAAPLTSQGSLLGTFQYMAPEQIEGEDADARADIWAFGCVLYEMATGKRAFEGKTQASLIAAILERKLRPMAELQPMTPPALDRIVRTCLAKDPDDRFQAARDVWLQLGWIKEGEPASAAAAPIAAQLADRTRGTWVAGAIALAALAGGAAWWLKPAPLPEARVVSRLGFVLPSDQAFSRIGRRYVAISPDGTNIVYVANAQLYLKRLDRLAAEPIRGTSEDPLEPIFSPDGQEIAYFVQGTSGEGSLRKVSVNGGAPQTLNGHIELPFGVTWRGHAIAFGQNGVKGNRIDELSDTPGPVRTLATIDAKEGLAIQPSWLDDGRRLVFVIMPEDAKPSVTYDDEAQIVLQDLDSGRRTALLRGGTSPRVVSDGHLLFIRDSTLLSAPLDKTRTVVIGGPTPVADDVNESLISWTGQFDVSRTGTLVYNPGRPFGGMRELLWVNQQGKEEHIPAAPQHAYGHMRLSPDGTKLAVDAIDGQADIWIWDFHKQAVVRLTFSPAMEFYPLWTSDGRNIIYRSLERGKQVPDIFRKAADGTGVAEPLTKNETGGEPSSLTPDDKSVVFRTSTTSPGQPWELRLAPLDGRSPITPLLTDPTVSELNGEISPNGHWIAYQSNTALHAEVFVRPFPNVEAGHWQVPVEGATRPAWSRAGDALFFESDHHLTEVAVHFDPSPTFGQPRPLFDLLQYGETGGPTRRWDVGKDGRFITSKPIRTEPFDQTLIVVSNWFDELKSHVK
jgi:Tol biopolymer transport system component